jgi:ribulose-5-phosphate 4-epimerase/fuculose-1-phosphate aldolase
MSESTLRASLVAYGRALFERGYGCGTSGNLSVRLDDGRFLMTPTNVALGHLTHEGLCALDASGRHVGGPQPTKEAWLHLAMYKARPHNRAIVHLHSTYAVALSCRTDLPEDDMLPALTPYVVMRVGQVAKVAYGRPGDAALAGPIEGLAARHRALLLANHGPIVSAPDLDAAWAAAEELEESARLFFLLENRPHWRLGPREIAELHQAFGKPE